MPEPPRSCSFFFFNDTATTEIYTLSLHDALPISSARLCVRNSRRCDGKRSPAGSPAASSRSSDTAAGEPAGERSEEHTSELQSQSNLVCRLLLEKKTDDDRQARPCSAAGHARAGR